MTTEPAIITYLRKYLELCDHSEQLAAGRTGDEPDPVVEVTIGPLKLTRAHVQDLVIAFDDLQSRAVSQTIQDDAKAACLAYETLVDLGLAARPLPGERTMYHVVNRLRDEARHHAMHRIPPGPCSGQGGCDCPTHED